MHLCFGVFASILNQCKKCITQEKLGVRLARCVDQNSSYIKIEDRYSEGWEIKGDGVAINKLFLCNRNFILSPAAVEHKKSISQIVEDFKATVEPYILKKAKPVIILTLLDIIREDKLLDGPTAETFKLYCGHRKNEFLHQTKFHFSDMMARILAYTTFGGVSNILPTFSPEDMLKKAENSHRYEYLWDPASLTLEMKSTKIYLQLLETMDRYKIFHFLEFVNPTDAIHWLDLQNCKKFIQTYAFMKGQKCPDATSRNVKKFVKVFRRFYSYLKKSMRPATPDQKHGYYVPLYREEDIIWAMEFEDKIRKYASQLAASFNKIRSRMLFDTDLI